MGPRILRLRSVVFGCSAAAIAVLAMSGCARVAPYERGLLAHPTMPPNDVTSAVDEHVRAVSEGAQGGLGAAGGGCGCN